MMGMLLFSSNESGTTQICGTIMFDYGVNSEYIHLIQLAQMLQQSIVLVQSWDNNKIPLNSKYFISNRTSFLKVLEVGMSKIKLLYLLHLKRYHYEAKEE